MVGVRNWFAARIEGGAFVDFGGSGAEGVWGSIENFWAGLLDFICGVLYGDGRVDAIDFEGGADGDFDACGVVCGAKNCAA